MIPNTLESLITKYTMEIHYLNKELSEYLEEVNVFDQDHLFIEGIKSNINLNTKFLDDLKKLKEEN